jgi:putative ABC transport system permease protein
MSWLTRLRNVFRSDKVSNEIDREMTFHLAERTDDLVASGMSRAAARREARRRFGNYTLQKEDTRERNLLVWLDTLGRDVRYGLRVLRRNPTFAVVALLTLAIGIGANTAVFTVVNSVLLKPLPYPDSDELVAVRNRAPGAPGFADVSAGLRLSLSMYVTYAEENRTFEHIGAWSTGTAAVTGRGEPEEVRTVFITDGTLQALAVPPRLGRWLSGEDQIPGGVATAMLTYGYWQRRFGGQPDAVGQIITIDNRPRQIVGIMPRGFRVADVDAEVILPVLIDRSRLIRPGFRFVGVARLKPGVTIAEANADIGRMLPVWLHGWPGGATQFYESMRITPALRPLKDDVVGNAGATLWLIMGTIAIVLLIACANVTNLLLIRAEGRQQEVAVRAALGAASWRLTRELLLESVLLSVLGGLLGLGVASAVLRVLVSIGPTGLPRLDEIALDGSALGFTLAVSLVSGVLLGLAPALKYPRRRIASSLQGSTRAGGTSRQRHRTQNVLVVVQVALAVVLLVGSGLMIRTFQALRSVDPGFTDPEQLQVMRIAVPTSLIAEGKKVLRLQNDLVDRLSAIPGVTSAASISSMPMEGIPSNFDIILVEDKPTLPGETLPQRVFKYVSPGLLRTTGARLLAGRDFTWNDIYDSRPVVMVSANLAREVWGAPAAAVGRRVRQGPDSQWCEVVGVVDDVRDNGVDAPAPAIVYWPLLLDARDPRNNIIRSATFVIRSRAAGTEAFLKQVQEAVWSVNGSLPVAAAQTMRDVYERSLSRTTFTLIMLAISSGMALALGVIGIYGVIAYVITQRRREIGIRLALGERQAELRRRFLRHGLVLTCVGLAIGLGVSMIVTRLMASLLFEVSPLDPLTYVAVALLLTTAAAIASYVPARRASIVPLTEVLAAQ